MIKRMAAGVLVAGLVTAGSAFAATFNVNDFGSTGDDAWIASGSTGVEACDDHVFVDIKPGDFVQSAGDWSIHGVKVHAGTDLGYFNDCDGYDLTVVLTDADGAELCTGTEEFPWIGIQSLDCDPETYVGDVQGVSLMFDEPNLFYN